MSDSYLTEEEIHKYCDKTIDNVELSDVLIASSLVDGYLGTSYLPTKRKEIVKLRKERAKLLYAPIIEITAVNSITDSFFGRSREALSPEDIEIDPENDGYFCYIGSYGLNRLVFNNKPLELEIEYISGFKEVPTRLKIAVAMLACNIREAKSFAGAKQMTSLDFQILMSDDSFFTSDIKMLLKGLESNVYI